MFRRIFAETARGFNRNGTLVVSIILVTFISLTFVGAAVLLQLQITQMKTYWYDKAQVAVYLCTDTSSVNQCPDHAATDDQKKAIEEQLKSSALSNYVKSYDYESQKEAYQHFKEQFKGNEALNFVSESDMAPTYWINLQKPSDPAQSGAVIQMFSSTPGVDQVVDQKAYLDQIFSVLNIGTYTAIAVAVLMIAAAILLIANTIRLSAHSRRRELMIMRMVGASNFYIRMPFLLEGVIAALIGSLLACVALGAVVQFFIQGYLAKSIHTVNLLTLLGAWPAYLIVIVVGLVVSAGAAGFSVRKHLRA